MILFVVLLISLVIILSVKAAGRHRIKNFPPGPLPFPFLGNIPQVGNNLRLTFEAWRKAYGSIVGFHLGNQACIVISDFEVMSRAFKEDVFSGRPANLQKVFSAFFSVGNELSTGGIVFSHGDAWKEQRKFASRTLKDFGVGKSVLQSVINEEVEKLVHDLEQEVDSEAVDLRLRTNLSVVNTLWQILNGEKSDLKNPKMQRVFKSTTEFIVSNTLAGPIMILPWLRHLPYFKTQFENSKKSPQEMREVTNESIQRHRETFQEDYMRDFIDCYLKKQQETVDPSSSFYREVGEGNLQRSMMDLFGAGSETTATILCFAFNYLIRFPEIQAKLQAEIDNEVGSRSPGLEDRVRMPYMDAFIHEVLRHSCVVYTTPHATTETVELEGFTLPKGTAVYPNVWWIMNDPAHWTEPSRFMPERFLDANGAFRKNERCIPFLVGKRYCLGQNLAQHELFLFLTGLLQKLSFSTVLPDPSHVNIDPIVGFMHQCPEFLCRIKSRN